MKGAPVSAAGRIGARARRFKTAPGAAARARAAGLLGLRLLQMPAELEAHRREFVDPKIQEHQGRIIKTTGDGMLVEFASVVDAMRCAAEVRAE